MSTYLYVDTVTVDHSKGQYGLNFSSEPDENYDVKAVRLNFSFAKYKQILEKVTNLASEAIFKKLLLNLFLNAFTSSPKHLCFNDSLKFQNCLPTELQPAYQKLLECVWVAGNYLRVLYLE